MMKILERLNNDVVFFDGGMFSLLQKLGLPNGEVPERSGKLTDVRLIKRAAFLIDEVAALDSFLRNAFVKLEDLVGIVADIEVPIPLNILSIDDVTTECNLNTIVADRTYINREHSGRVTRRKRNVLAIKKVCSNS